jgi:tyrosinase
MRSIILVFILFIICSYANYFTDQLPPGCGSFRTRTAWGALTPAQKTLFAKIVYQMKLDRGAWLTGNTNTYPVYDLFVQIHATGATAAAWHGTSFFLPAHKWYLWVYESACILTAYKHMTALGITQNQACNIAVPYWDWTLDFDSNSNDNICPVLTENNSGIWNSNAFGTATVQYPSYYVRDGIAAQSGWVTVAKTSNSWQNPTSSQYPFYDNHLKRELYCGPDGYNLNVGPSQAMNMIVTNKQFLNFATWLETTMHGIIHMFCGFSMSQMVSPDDPLFFLHHCNVDRLYHVWIDCQGYENIPSSSITSAQYAANPTSKDNPDPNLPDYTFSSTSEMPYYWGESTTTIFPKIRNGKWPSPKDVWSSGFPGAPGFDGMYYRYGPDQLVRGFGKTCPDTKWTLVDPGYVSTKKRDESLHPMIQTYKATLDEKVSEGKTEKEALREMAMTECEKAPKNEITPELLEWFKMNSLLPENYDSICDKPSKRIKYKVNSNDKGNATALKQDTTTLKEDTTTLKEEPTTTVPLWVIITVSVGSAIILIAVLSIIFFTIRRKGIADK